MYRNRRSLEKGRRDSGNALHSTMIRTMRRSKSLGKGKGQELDKITDMNIMKRLTSRMILRIGMLLWLESCKERKWKEHIGIRGLLKSKSRLRLRSGDRVKFRMAEVSPKDDLSHNLASLTCTRWIITKKKR